MNELRRWPQFEDLLGQTVAAIRIAEDKELMEFHLADGRTAKLYHSQDCCESVELEEVVGDLADLIGSPLLIAEEVQHDNETPEGTTPPEYAESYTWSFYKLATVKGHVTLRWLGESNGYYSESVAFDLQPSSPHAPSS